MRNHLLDNAKAVFMVMVVLGHLIEPLRGVHATHQALYLYLYTIHIPGLVLLSGAVAHRELALSVLAKNVRSLLVPFVVFELLYEGLYLVMHGEVSAYARGVEPYWLLWYLPSLFLWRMMFPIVCLLRAPLLISILVALLVSCSEGTGYFLGISRTFVLFPFFVAGALQRTMLTQAAPSKLLRAVACAVLVCGAYVAFRVRGEAPGWVYGSESFITLHVNLGWGVLIRLGVYSVSLVLVWAVIALVPRTSTTLGVRSVNMLYVYLWHGVFIRLADDLGWFSSLKGVDPAIVYPFYSALAVGVFVLLSSDFVKRYTDRLMPRTS